MNITPREFRCLLDLYMVSDPFPLFDGQGPDIQDMLDRLSAEAKPEATWVDAFHYYHPDSFGRVWWLPQSELCKICGQPDNRSDCSHERIADVSQLGAVLL